MMMSIITILLRHPKATHEHLGLIPYMLDPDDRRPAREQFDENYQHGGGWRPFKGHTLMPNDDLQYPDDPPLKPLAEMRLRNERILMYEFGWVVIIQPDGSYETCRMD